MREPNQPGYRPRSLEARDNYGLSPEQLVAYLRRHGCNVPEALLELVTVRAAQAAE